MLRLARELCAFFTQQANAYKIEYETQFLINQIMKLNIISISNKLKKKKKQETKTGIKHFIEMWNNDSSDLILSKSFFTHPFDKLLFFF